MINKENSIKLLFEFNKVLNDHSKDQKEVKDDDLFTQTKSNEPESLVDNNTVTFKISRYEPLLFQEFRELYYKQEFFRDQTLQVIREVKGNSNQSNYESAVHSQLKNRSTQGNQCPRVYRCVMYNLLNCHFTFFLHRLRLVLEKQNSFVVFGS